MMRNSLQKAFAHYCIDHELTFTDAVIEALKEYLAKHDRSSGNFEDGKPEFQIQRTLPPSQSLAEG